MALIRADRVKESSTSTGTGAFTLAGADSTYRTFGSVCAVADTVYYAIAHRTSNEWEVGLGTYSATNTLTRTTVHASSNANAAVNFSAGTKDVLLALTKTQLETYASLAGSETLTNKTISGASNTITNVSLSTGVTGTLPLANGGTGATTAQLAMNSLAGAVTSGSYLRGNGTNVVMATIQAADVPTLNQNTTGTASGSVSGTASYVPKFTAANVVGNSQIYDTGSNVGIGTTSPGAQLHVTTAAAATKGLIVKGAAAQSASVLELQNSSGVVAYRVNYDAAGTSHSTFAPGANQTVYHATYSGPSTSYNYCAFGYQATIGSFGYSGIGSYLSANGAPIYIHTFSSDDIVFVPGNSEKMRVKADGTVGIGTTSPSDKLHVVGAVRSSGYTGGDGTYLALTGDLPGYLANRYPTLRSDGSIYFAVSSRYAGYLSSVDNSLNICNTSTQWKVGLNPSGTSYFAGGSVAIGDTTATGQLHVASQAAATKGLVVRGASGQSANLEEWQNNAGAVLAAIKPDGSIQPASMADSAATNNSIYYSTTAGKLVYKDGAGTVNNLY